MSAVWVFDQAPDGAVFGADAVWDDSLQGWWRMKEVAPDGSAPVIEELPGLGTSPPIPLPVLDYSFTEAVWRRRRGAPVAIYLPIASGPS